MPVYLRFLGASGFGLLGFGMLLQMIVLSLDLGVGQTAVREIARLAAARAGDETRGVFRTFEAVAALCGAAVAAALLVLAPWLASRWLSDQSLAPEALRRALVPIGLQCGLQWMVLVYQSVLLGLERQVLLSAVRLGEAIARVGGSIVLLALGAVGLQGVLVFQLGVTALLAAALGAAAHRLLPAPGRAAPAIRWSYLGRVWRFSAGMAGIALCGFILNNGDRLLVSKLFSLEEYGHYAAAWLGASVIPAILIAPLFSATFPRFVALDVRQEVAATGALFHTELQLLALLALPTAAVLTFVSPALMRLWTGSAEVGGAAAAPLALLAWGWALNALMVPAFTLQLASGLTRLTLTLNVALVAAFVPATWMLASRLGLRGAALGFLLMNGTYLCAGLPLVVRELLPGQLARTIARDLAPAAAASLVALGLARALLAPASSWAGLVAQAAIGWLVLAGGLARFVHPQVASLVPWPLGRRAGAA